MCLYTLFIFAPWFCSFSFMQPTSLTLVSYPCNNTPLSYQTVQKRGVLCLIWVGHDSDPAPSKCSPGPIREYTYKYSRK